MNRIQGLVAALVVPVALCLVGIVFALEVLGSLAVDTTKISNSAFAIIAALAALAFGWSRALDASDPRRELIRLGGEQLTSAALKFICASLLKYAVILAGANERYIGGWLSERIRVNGIFWETLDWGVAILVTVLFVLGVVSSAFGVTALVVASETTAFRVESE